MIKGFLRRRLLAALALLVMACAGCAGLDYSERNPYEPDFHPKSIAVLPAVAEGGGGDAAGSIVAQRLAGTGWFSRVVAPDSIKERMNSSPAFAAEVEAYTLKISAVGVSDPEIAKRLGERLNADAILITYVTAWEYGVEKGGKVARAGLGMRLVNASDGAVVWKAGHGYAEDYIVFRPRLEDLIGSVADRIIKEMPH